MNKTNALSLPQDAHNVYGPARVLLILDRLEEALNSVFGIRASEFTGLLVVQNLDSFIGPYVDLGVNVAPVLLNVFEGVSGVSVHVMIPVWSSAVGKEYHDLMNGLGVLGQVILFKPVGHLRQDAGPLTYPEHIGIFQVRLGVPLLSVNEMGELCRIAEEKDWSVVEHPIEVPFFGLDLDRKSLHIPDPPGHR